MGFITSLRTIWNLSCLYFLKDSCGAQRILLRAPLFLADLRADPGERRNLADEQPERAEQMRRAALQWREGIERTWKEQFAGNYQCLT